MPDSGPSRPAKTGSRTEPVNGEFAELRELLLGPERAELAALRERVQSRARRISDLGEVLPDAILLRASQDPQLRQALQPLIEQALSISVRKDPSILSEALFPMIGRAVRRAVSSTLQGMIESLNQIIETSFSLRSFGWRLEAIRTGKTYGEIALLRSLLYRVEQVFLIQNDSGLLLQHVIRDSALIRDPDMVSGMLTAIQNFVRDSFGAAGGALETVRLGDFTLWIQLGPQATLAAAIQGTPPPQIEGALSAALEAIHSEFGSELAAFRGDASGLNCVRPIMQSCLLGQSPPGRRASRLPLYGIAALLVLGVAAWAGNSIRENRRWDRYLAALSREPGIVIAEQGRHGGGFRISGLRDPLARDPERLLAGTGISPTQVSSRWEPYLSLSPRLAAMRRIPELAARIEQQVIRFDNNGSVLMPSAVDSIRSIADTVKELSKAGDALGERIRIEITGHTDHRGSEKTNLQLGLARSTAVEAAMRTFGVEADMAVRSAGSREPVVISHSPDTLADNRSVTFRVVRTAGRNQP